MFDRFTDRARKVMSLARKEAQRFNHDFIGTEHILLGIIQEGSGVAANVLRNLGVEINKIRPEIEKNVKSGPSMGTMGQPPFTPRAKKVLEWAMEEANDLGHNYIGTEHLLLGTIWEADGVAAQVLLDCGVELGEVREEVLLLLGASGWGFRDFRDALDRACEAAARLEEDCISSGLILLGLFREPSGFPAEILGGLGIWFEDLQSGVEKRLAERREVTAGTRTWSCLTGGGLFGLWKNRKKFPFTAFAEKLLDRAEEEAKALGYKVAGSEHLLLAILQDPSGEGAQVFIDLGLRLEDVRARVLQAMETRKPESRPAGDQAEPEARQLRDRDGRVRARMALRRDGSPLIELLDAKGIPRITLGLDPHGNPSLEFRDEAGKVISKLPELPAPPSTERLRPDEVPPPQTSAEDTERGK